MKHGKPPRKPVVSLPFAVAEAEESLAAEASLAVAEAEGSLAADGSHEVAEADESLVAEVKSRESRVASAEEAAALAAGIDASGPKLPGSGSPPFVSLAGSLPFSPIDDAQDALRGLPDATFASAPGVARPFDAGDFRLVTRLAVGGMAEVWLADALQGALAGRTVVLKRLLPMLRSDPGSVGRFREEARLGIALDHPNIARSFALLERPPELLLVQELLGGETLQQLAAAAHLRGERLAPEAVLHAVGALVEALGYLHGGPLPLVHADVNPDNLVARPDGGVKLIDLGLAQALQPDGTASNPDGALRGTPAYMSPEQVKSRPLDARSDLFSAGVVLWELLACRPLFAAEAEFETLRRVREMPAPPLRAVWPQAPTSLERLCVRALAKDPSQRFQTAPEFAEALRQSAAREGLQDGEQALALEVARLAPRAPRAE